jgi:cytochrome c oxidase subunit 3
MNKEEMRQKTAKPMMGIAIGSMIMLFAGLTSALVVRKGEGNWLQFDMPQYFYFSTAVMLLSSLTMNMASSASKNNQHSKIKTMLGLTLTLGLIFIILQVAGWGQLYDQKVVFAGKESNASGSFMYVLTGLHLAHLVGGIIYLLVVFGGSLKEKYNSNNRLSIQLCAIYWHFLDLLWIYLFLFLLFIR